MFVAPADRSFGEEPKGPKKQFISSSKGYPAVQDPCCRWKAKKLSF